MVHVPLDADDFRLQIRKEALEGAIENVDAMHEMATKQKDMLEEAAFVSVRRTVTDMQQPSSRRLTSLDTRYVQVQLPSERVIEAAQETEVMELQGYLIKQGGGGNAFNPLGRRNWKQRYFILIGTNLAYAKTKDDYERGRIIKELNLAGCVSGLSKPVCVRIRGEIRVWVS